MGDGSARFAASAPYPFIADIAHQLAHMLPITAFSPRLDISPAARSLSTRYLDQKNAMAQLMKRFEMLTNDEVSLDGILHGQPCARPAIGRQVFDVLGGDMAMLHDFGGNIDTSAALPMPKRWRITARRALALTSYPPTSDLQMRAAPIDFHDASTTRMPLAHCPFSAPPSAKPPSGAFRHGPSHTLHFAIDIRRRYRAAKAHAAL